MTVPATVATFRAIGTDVHVGVRDPRDLGRARSLAQSVLADVDEVCSRFRDDSDLAAVNRSPGRWVAVDPMLVWAVQVACEAARESNGLVSPLLGRTLVQLGYDRDFALLGEVEDVAAVLPIPAPGLDAWREIDLDPDGAVRIPAGSALDLGATGKAWAADLIATAHEERLGGASLVSVGGDLRIAAPDGEPWTIAVTERPGARPEELVTLLSGAMATSTTQVRRWSRGRARRHHLIDPRTGLPADEVWRTVTATGASCVGANTATTAAVVLGAEAPTWLEERGVTARLVAGSGAVHTVGSWPRCRSAA